MRSAIREIPRHLEEPRTVLIREEEWRGRKQFVATQGDYKVILDSENPLECVLKDGALVRVWAMRNPNRGEIVFCQPLLVVADPNGQHPLVNCGRAHAEAGGYVRVVARPNGQVPTGTVIYEGGLEALEVEIRESEFAESQPAGLEELLTVRVFGKGPMSFSVQYSWPDRTEGVVAIAWACAPYSIEFYKK